MSDPGKVIVALSFFGTLAYIIRLMVLKAPWSTFGESRTTHNVVVDNERMTRLEQAVESIALEVERISEGQRFTTKLLADRAQAEQLRSVSPADPIRHRTPH
jgi:predicted oxidoreductase